MHKLHAKCTYVDVVKSSTVSMVLFRIYFFQNESCLQNLAYQTGDPAFEFIVRPYENKRVTLQSRKFANSFLSVNQSAAVSVREMPPDSSEVQFAVYVQVCILVCMTFIANSCNFYLRTFLTIILYMTP